MASPPCPFIPKAPKVAILPSHRPPQTRSVAILPSHRPSQTLKSTHTSVTSPTTNLRVTAITTVLLWRKKTTQNGKGYKESLTNCLRASSRLVMNLRVRTVHALSAMITTLLPPLQPLLLLPNRDDQRSAQRKRGTSNSTAPQRTLIPKP